MYLLLARSNPLRIAEKGVFMSLYALCANKFAFFDAVVAYCKQHAILTSVLVACVLLCFTAVFLLISQSKNLAQKKQRAEDALIFLSLMEKEHQAREEAKARAEKNAEEEHRKRRAKAKEHWHLPVLESTENKSCLFCGTLNPPHAVYCEECACRAFGSQEEYLAHKEKTSRQLVRKQEAREARKHAMNAIGVFKPTKYSGSWTVIRSFDSQNEKDECYFFHLLDHNGEKLLASEEYPTYSGAMKGIELHKTNILNDNFRFTLSKNGQYIHKLLMGKSTLLCASEEYPTRADCEKSVETIKRYANTAFIAEAMEETPLELATEIPCTQTVADGQTGKWVIASKLAQDCETAFYFELFNNEGARLLSSEEYTSYIGAINGITTHKKNIEAGNFRVSLTKDGDFCVKLLNANGQLLCLCERYKTRSLCQAAIAAIKNFAQFSPVITDSPTAALIRKK